MKTNPLPIIWPAAGEYVMGSDKAVRTEDGGYARPDLPDGMADWSRN